jgi:hypothetical protein
VALIETLAGARPSLTELLDDLPQLADGFDLGADLEEANRELLDPGAGEEAKRTVLWRWIGRWQPCLFGRLASHQGSPGAARGLGADLCWIDDAELALGEDHLAARIQAARRAWKDRAERGRSSGFLIMFNSRRLARARQSPQLVRLCRRLSDLYLVEHAPVQADTIYTEAVPFRRPDGQLTLFKAGCNIFYGGAHRTRNHDRRVPGGLLFSMNSPGHFANCMVQAGHAEDLAAAADFVRETAYRSIGNGGLGDERAGSATWHNRCGPDSGAAGPERRRPAYVPADFDPARYSGAYHTDVLVPAGVTADPSRVDGAYADHEVWAYLMLDYITAEEFPRSHVNHGLFHGEPVDDCNRYHNPWPARAARNAADFEY